MSAEPSTRTRARPSGGATKRIADVFDEVRGRTEELCAGLSPEDASAQSRPDASPVKWHLAHTSWFFETFVLAPRIADYRPFDAQFSFLFNSYYNAVGERIARAARGMITRPSLGEVMQYRRHVDERMRELLASSLGADRAVVELGCHHEQQHQELVLTDLKHLLSLNPLRPAFRERIESTSTCSSAPMSFVPYGEGLRWSGHEGERFAFDNEMPRHRVFVDAFEIASRPATNGEYLEFIADGGYARPELWLSDGWDAAVSQGWHAPLYWEAGDDRWLSFTLSGLREIDPAEPVCHVSYYEADAFARWSHARLPREAEWETAAASLELEGNFAESGRFHPCTVAAVPTERSSPAFAPRAMFGDVWEWTQSAYGAYPGYRPAEGALGEYNGKFMCGQIVLRGGSCASPRSHLRASYRNFFPPAARWQFSGIRLARDV